MLGVLWGDWGSKSGLGQSEGAVCKLCVIFKTMVGETMAPLGFRGAQVNCRARGWKG